MKDYQCGEKMISYTFEFWILFLFPDLKPKVAVQMLPGLPAYILFMMIRHTDYYNDDEAVKSLIQGAINMIKKVVKKKGMNDLDVSFFDIFFKNAI